MFIVVSRNGLQVLNSYFLIQIPFQPLIFQTLITWSNRTHSLINQKHINLGCKEMRISGAKSVSLSAICIVFNLTQF